MEAFLGILGIIVGWLVTHYYYRRQIKEQINPLPHIQGVHQAVLEIYGMAIQRQDTELQKAVRTLVIEMLHTRNRVLNSLVPAAFTFMYVNDLYKLEDGMEIKNKLNELEPSVIKAQKRLSEAGHEYDGLIETVEKIAGKKVSEMFTEEEFIEILRDPRNSSRAKQLAQTSRQPAQLE
jgi:hypothetical protein